MKVNKENIKQFRISIIMAKNTLDGMDTGLRREALKMVNAREWQEKTTIGLFDNNERRRRKRKLLFPTLSSQRN